MKRLLTVLVILTLLLSLGLATVIPAFSADTGTITVTIESAQVSVMVNPTSVNYGVVGLHMTGVMPGGDPMIMAQNTGNWWAHFQVKGADTTGGWILSDAAGDNAYIHYFGPVPQPPTPPPEPVTYTKLAKSYQDLGGVSYSPHTGVWFKLKMDTPILSAFGGSQNTTITVMVTKEEVGLTLNLTTDNNTYTHGEGPALLSANVTNQVGAPVSGLTDFLVFVNKGNPPTPGISPVIAQTIALTDAGGGIYTGSVDISSLDTGDYSVGICTNDGSHYVSGGCPITIVIVPIPAP